MRATVTGVFRTWTTAIGGTTVYTLLSAPGGISDDNDEDCQAYAAQAGTSPAG